MAVEESRQVGVLQQRYVEVSVFSALDEAAFALSGQRLLDRNRNRIRTRARTTCTTLRYHPGFRRLSL